MLEKLQKNVSLFLTNRLLSAAMKLPLCSALGLSLVLVSCSALDPDYAAYKKQKEAEAAGPAPFGQQNDYGVPGGETGGYAPLQPLPGIPGPDPIAPLPTPGPTPFPGVGPTPGVGLAPAPIANTQPHTVVKGDSLWGLARKYGTTIEAIQAANGLANADIQTGRTLQIPSNN